MSAASSEITYGVDGPVATVTLNRPQALNAWTDKMDDLLRDAVTRAAEDPAVVGIVIAGAGRAFCAGADMGMLQGNGRDHRQRTLSFRRNLTRRCPLLVYQLQKPCARRDHGALAKLSPAKTHPRLHTSSSCAAFRVAAENPALSITM